MPQPHFRARPDAFRSFFEQHPDGLGIVDFNGRFVEVNTSLSEMFGYSQDELLQASLNELLHASGVDLCGFCGKGKARAELAVLHKEGFFVPVRMTCFPALAEGREFGRFIAFEAAGKRRHRDRDLSDIQEMFSFISEKSQNIISSFTADGAFAYISPTVTALLGYSPEEVIGRPAEIFNHPDDNERLHGFRNSVVIDRDTERFTGRVRHKNGEYRWYETTVEYIRDESGAVVQTIGVGRDITDRKEAEETIAHMAYHDPLTDLPNRRSFDNRARRHCEGPHAVHGLVLLDLDGFKSVNDTLGHDMGDRLLIEVARRLSKAVGDEGIVARWGGDEFTIFQANLEKRGDMASLTSRVEQAISEPLRMAGHTLSIAASIGIAYFPADGDTVQELIRHADAAMYRVKRARHDRIEQEGR